MKAVVVVTEAGGEASLAIASVDAPEPGPLELLVRVRAAALNRTDLRRQQEHFTAGAGAPHIPGLEMAGEVIGMGTGVVGWALGDRVMGMAAACYAEQAVIDHRVALVVPAGLDWQHAAAIPIAFLTAHDALMSAGQFKRGQTVLVQAAASTVGMVAVQLASLFGAGMVLGTARDAGRLAPLKALGLTHGIVSTQTDFAQEVARHTGGRGVDVIIDMVGGGVLAGNLACAAPGARLVSVGRLGGMTDTIDLNLLALQRVSLVGVTFRSRDIAQKLAINQYFLADCQAPLEDGRLRPFVDRVYPLEQALQAQERVRSNAHVGKVILTP